jgi:hypothetical protein
VVNNPLTNSLLTQLIDRQRGWHFRIRLRLPLYGLEQRHGTHRGLSADQVLGKFAFDLFPCLKESGEDSAFKQR